MISRTDDTYSVSVAIHMEIEHLAVVIDEYEG
jgi:hypothetical protein